jgi:Fur family peroxide stress response transcriptional regulator
MEYDNLLKKNNLKTTPQRLLIIEKLHKEGHLSVDDLYIALKERFISISLATIYKNINIMTQKSVIQEVKIPNQKSVYELTKQEHSHVVCSKCNNIYDLQLDTHDLLKQANSLGDFCISSSVVLFNGTCKECM